MLNYVIKRLLGLIPTLLIVAVLVFLFVHMLPGDPARLIAGPRPMPRWWRWCASSWGLTSRCMSSSGTISPTCCGRFWHLDGLAASGCQ
jgi:ABC-type dipeptide/oligopeptide/nickel transport system permease component